MEQNAIKIIKLSPEGGKHLKDVRTGDIAEKDVYLGKFDSADNYVEVTEEEYQEWLVAKEKEAEEMSKDARSE